jgi:aerobic-type carbon monoxide dehydrogenase small subunit (CoxS/CutS family)
MRVLITLHINGELREVAVLPHHTLLEVLREDLGLTGTKHGCELGECGACTVLIDGLPVLSCLTLPLEVQNSEITTIEGLEENGKLHPLQETFAELGAAQCGYCTPGILLAGVALLRNQPHPTLEQMKDALAGNLCRCTGYTKIYEAIDAAAERLHAAGGVS